MEPIIETPEQEVQKPLAETPEQEVQKPITETPEPEVPEEKVLEELEEEPAPKRRGRPVGSKSKIPGKPRAKAVKKVLVPEQSFTKDEAEEPEQDTRNRPLAGSRSIPAEAHDATSARIISLLQTQMRDRKTRKVQLWKSWFR